MMTLILCSVFALGERKNRTQVTTSTLLPQAKHRLQAQSRKPSNIYIPLITKLHILWYYLITLIISMLKLLGATLRPRSNEVL